MDTTTNLTGPPVAPVRQEEANNLRTAAKLVERAIAGLDHSQEVCSHGIKHNKNHADAKAYLDLDALAKRLRRWARTFEGGDPAADTTTT